MATSMFPNVRDHYVYVGHALGYPFYVGEGHAGRLRERLKHIDMLVRLHSRDDRSYHKWELHHKVTDDLQKAGVEVHFDQLSERQTKAESVAHQDKLVIELMQQGFLLSNVNSSVRPLAEIVKAVLARNKKWGFLEGFRPIDSAIRPWK